MIRGCSQSGRILFLLELKLFVMPAGARKVVRAHIPGSNRNRANPCIALSGGHYISALWIGEFSSTCLLCSPEMDMFWNRISLGPQCFSGFGSCPFTSAYFCGSFGTIFYAKKRLYTQQIDFPVIAHNDRIDTRNQGICAVDLPQLVSRWQLV